MLIESSTVTCCGPAACMSISVRPRHGRISASRPCTRWLRLSLVATCTVRSQLRRAAWVAAVSGVAAAKLPPMAKNTFARPSRMASIAPMVSWPGARGGSNPNTSRSRSRNACGGFSQIIIVRSPCTLLCPRTGQAPAPGRPRCPPSSSRLQIIWMVATECRCWVMPMPQQQIRRSAARYVSPTRRTSSSVRPDSSVIVPQDSAVTSAANVSKPLVCASMNPRSSSEGRPAATSSASRSSACLMIPFTAARSPPIFSCR